MSRSSRYQHRRKLMGEINVVPYIDVMLVLLVIFMITAPLLQQGVDVNLPQTAAKTLSTKDLAPIIVSVDKSGHYYLNISTNPHTPVKVNALIEQVNHKLSAAKKYGRQQDIYVQGDEDASYGKVVTLMAVLQQNGINKIGLVTKNPPQNRSP